MKPKQTFQKTAPLANAWGDIITRPEFDTAVNTAMLEMIERQPIRGTPSESWDHHSQVVGARIFLDILRNLHLPDPNPVNVPMPNLKSPR